MALIKNFPTPSDRMAIISLLLNVEDSIVLEYGPEGTTHFSMNFFNQLGQNYTSRLFSTGLDDEDVIMGDSCRLERGILELDFLYKPKAIFVLTSSVTSIIGTDIEGICSYLQQSVHCRLIPINTSGLSVDFSAGLRNIYLKLVEELLNPSDEKNCMNYNILGASMMNFRVESDVWELQNLMQESFGYKLRHCFAIGTSIEAISELGDAELNIVLTNEALPCAEYIKKTTGCPYVYLPPYGYNGTIAFLEEVSKCINKPIPYSVISRLRDKDFKAKMIVNSPILDKKNKRIVLKGNYDIVKGFCKFFEELGFEIKFSVYNHKIIPETKDKSVTYIKNEREWLDITKKLQGYFILADELTIAQCYNSNYTLCISQPCTSFRVVAKHLPFMGEKGADMIFEYLHQYLNK